ncbi:hypothetical protein [Hymenobacter sp. APR13]|uniref:hypothetical protein n=1 Tax=Hymenobacter sp. APR13 TaxID=1356852 RepID=UPI0012DFF74C|nr:hypothetical protein [Hymenobacter sp. APR13]
MLINNLRSFALILPHIKDECCENGFAACVDPAINKDDFIIIKVDEYYNSLSIKRPPSPDCLIIIRCSQGDFNIYIVELRDIASSEGFEIEKIREKFLTCLNDFMMGVLSQFFLNTTHVLKKPRLFLLQIHIMKPKEALEIDLIGQQS